MYEEVKGRPAFLVDEIINAPQEMGRSQPAALPAERPGPAP